jgi:hypothetical protein
MSVAVELDRLGAEFERFGRWAYVVSVSDNGRPHLVSAPLGWDGTVFTVTTGGRHTSANAAKRPDLSLLWAPYEPGGYSLIVDAAAVVGPDGGLTLTPTRGVLHRTGADGGSDCAPL